MCYSVIVNREWTRLSRISLRNDWQLEEDSRNKVNKMSKVKVIFNNVNEINDFVNIVNRFPVKMAMYRGHLKVGATSILGIINLGVNKRINLDVPNEVFENVKTEIEPYIAA